MRIVLLGPPGCGKGTQAKILSKKLKLPIISTGDLIRNEIKKKSKFGLLAKKYNDRGLLIPGKYAADLIKKNVENKTKYILDGFPRDLSQAKKFGDKNIDKVVYIYASNKVIIKRLLRRAKIEGRKDDTFEIIKKRILVYEKETKPLLKYYKNKLIKVNGDKDLKEVTREILKKLK